MELDGIPQEMNVCRKNWPKSKALEIPKHKGIEDKEGPGEQQVNLKRNL